ncbi:hypothetical protein SGCOL_004427 [Colletotrichum sp. CLE4]
MDQTSTPLFPAEDQNPVTGASSAFLMCLQLAIVEMASSLLLVSIGIIVQLIFISKHAVKFDRIDLTDFYFCDGSTQSERKAILKAAKRAKKMADSERKAQKAARKEAKKSLDSGSALVTGNSQISLFHEKGVLDETEAALDWQDASINLPSPSTTRSGIDFSSFGLPQRKKKKKTKSQKKATTATVTAGDAQVTAFPEPRSGYAHNCLGPSNPSTLRKAYWVD